MRAYIDGHPVEIRPGYRVDGRGRAATSVSLSIPLRTDDLVAILYTSNLTAAQLADADHVRAAIAELVVERGTDRITRAKATLRALVLNRALDQPRFDACRQRVRTLFPRADSHRAAKRSA